MSQSSNETIEAYTGHHIGPYERPHSLKLDIASSSPTKQTAMESKIQKPIQSNRKGEVAEGLPGSHKSVACVKRNTGELGRPNSFLVCSEVSEADQKDR